MELLIALLTFFSVNFHVDGYSCEMQWEGEQADQVYYSPEYEIYLINGGVPIFDGPGLPAINVWIDPDKE